MAARTPRVPLTDIRDAIERIGRYTKRHTSDSFGKDELVRDAVERCIEIISEASRRIPPALKAKHPQIPWDKVAGVGNVFRHDYDEVYPPLVWEIVSDHLPALRRAVNSLLRESATKGRKHRS